MKLSERIRNTKVATYSRPDMHTLADEVAQLEAENEDAKMLTIHHATHIIGLELRIKALEAENEAMKEFIGGQMHLSDEDKEKWFADWFDALLTGEESE